MFKEMSIEALREMYRRSKQELSDYEECMDKFDEEFLTREEAAEQAARLKERVQSIEEVIDEHLLWLYRSSKGVVNEEKLNQAKGLTYNGRLNLLIYQNERLQRKCSGKRLRLVSVIQSYSVLDSTQFRDARFMIQRLEWEQQQKDGAAPLASEASGADCFKEERKEDEESRQVEASAKLIEL